ncbi:MAG: hypothetical protein FRX49_12997 [Trebouxia sp. A1-2]|nr:MAG: hypothetical protein FRX49_12997 [Trebouxia sp. A1-2]
MHKRLALRRNYPNIQGQTICEATLYLLQTDDGSVRLIHIPQQFGTLQTCPRHLPSKSLKRGRCGGLKMPTHSAQLGLLQPALPSFCVCPTHDCQLSPQSQNGFLQPGGWKEAGYGSAGLCQGQGKGRARAGQGRAGQGRAGQGRAGLYLVTHVQQAPQVPPLTPCQPLITLRGSWVIALLPCKQMGTALKGLLMQSQSFRPAAGLFSCKKLILKPRGPLAQPQEPCQAIRLL